MGIIQIEFSTGPNSGQVVQLSNRSLVFGRSSDSDVLLHWDRLVSSLHFKIQKVADRYVLQDLGSTNGTLVNRKSVRSHELANGDQIMVGKTILLVKEIVEAKATFENTVLESTVLEHTFENTRVPLGGVEPTGFSSGFTQIRLRVASNEDNEKLYWLNLGQSSTFGSTEKSDYAIPSDPSLSSEHFRVSCEADECTIEDLESQFGVWLNGKKISRARLRNGDQVRAGETEFLIEIQGVATADASEESSKASSIINNPAKLRPQSNRIYDVSRSQCASGIVRLRGKVFEEEEQADNGIIEFFETMHAFAPLQVLIDFSRICLPLTKEIDAEKHSLFDWLPSGLIEKSPMLFGLDELANWRAFVEEGWGSDAVIGLRSELSTEELLVKFQDLLMGSSNGPEASKGILGFCWPSVLEALMENNSNGFTDSFFADVRLVLIEKQGKPENWQLFGKESQVEQAMKIGMRIEKNKLAELAK